MSEINENLEKIYFVDRDSAQRLVDEAKEAFAPIAHTHTFEEVGADQKGAAVAALTLAKEHTDTQVAGIQEKLDNHTHTIDDITDIDQLELDVDTELSSESSNPVANSVIVAGINSAIETAKEEINTTIASTVTSVNGYTDEKIGEIVEQFDDLDTELAQHMGNTSAHLTDNEKVKIEEAYTHITEGHAPIDAEKNVIVGITRNGEAVTVSENRIVDIVVPTTAEEIGADPKDSAKNALDAAKKYTDNSVSGFQAHVDNDDIHFTVAERKKLEGIQEGANFYEPEKLEVSAGTYTKVTVNENGHVVSGSNPTTLEGYGITDAVSEEELTTLQEAFDTHKESTSHITDADRTKLNGIESGAQKNTVFGVKGSAETDFRTGNIDITAANIGLGNVNNTSDANKPVSSAQKTAIDAAESNAKSYTDGKVANLASNSSVDTKVSTHNTSTSAHGDIRELITNLTTRLNTVANSDDVTLDQLSEIVAYIKNNKTLIDGITSSKINTTDIVTNLTTNSNTKVAAASTVVTLKGLIDSLNTELDNQVASLNSAIGGKAPNVHTHAIADITNLQTTLAGKAPVSHTHTASQISDVTVTAAEINKLAGVTDKVQEQLDGKAPTSHNHAASNITSGTLSSDRLPVIPASKGGTGQTTLLSSAYTLIDSLSEGSSSPADDVYYITQYAGTDSNNSGSYYKRKHSLLWDYIREKINLILGLTPTQYNGKAATATKADTASTATTLTGLTATVAELNKMDGVTATTTEINYVDGVTSNIQTQLDGKSSTSHTHNYAGSSSAGGSASTVALSQGVTDTARYIPFQDSANSTTVYTACYDADFQYNPVTNELFAQNLKATTATFSDSATIQYNSDTESIDFTFA